MHVIKSLSVRKASFKDVSELISKHFLASIIDSSLEFIFEIVVIEASGPLIFRNYRNRKNGEDNSDCI